MPKGPNGQKRPADVIGAANMVARIATGEITDTPAAPKGAAGGKARAEALAPQKRSEIASLAAKKRWQGKEGRVNMRTPDKKPVTHGQEVACMYPNNSLREPVREYHNTVAEVVKNTFTR
jgi:hypothetical protein